MTRSLLLSPTTERSWSSRPPSTHRDAAKCLCVSYDPIPFPEDKALKLPQKKRQTLIGTLKDLLRLCQCTVVLPPLIAAERLSA